jgi:hypothetical protein
MSARSSKKKSHDVMVITHKYAPVLFRVGAMFQRQRKYVGESWVTVKGACFWPSATVLVSGSRIRDNNF